MNEINHEHITQDLRYIGEILYTGDSILVKNPDVGYISVDKGNVGKSGNGLQHIIEQRFEKDRKSVDEITAMLALVLNSTEDGKVTRNVEILHDNKDIGTFDIEKNGIIAFVSKTRDGKDEKFVITGFDDFSKKDEAGDAIEAVIANNSYAPEFVIVKEQVVATLASSYTLHLEEIKRNTENGNLKKANLEKSKLEPYEKAEELKEILLSKSQKQLPEEKVLYGHTYVEVNGINHECKNGVLQGFKDAVIQNTELKNENQQLKNENDELHKQLEAKSQRQAHKNSRSGGMSY